MPKAVVVENLSKRFLLGETFAGTLRERLARTLNRSAAHSTQEEFWALRDVGFEVEQGEAIGIIGGNGAGKSTLLKILSRITPPTKGRALVRGRLSSLLEVGTGFHPELTGRENIYLNGAILGMRKQEIVRKFDEIVDFSGVSKFIDTPVKRYSSGMHVRLAFAVAAHLEPEVLIIDEVLAVGDADFQSKCLGKMSELGVAGRTVLFVSHNMSAIEQLTSRAIVLEKGRISWVGKSSEATNFYLNRKLSSAATVEDLSNAKRVAWAGDLSIKIVAAQMLDIHQGRIVPNGRIRLRLDLKCAHDVSDYRLGVTLHSRAGDPIGNVHTEGLGGILEGEVRTHELTLNDPGLAPGYYWFTVGVLRKERELIDVVQEVMHFELYDPMRLPSGYVDWKPGWGDIALRATVSQV